MRLGSPTLFMLAVALFVPLSACAGSDDTQDSFSAGSGGVAGSGGGPTATGGSGGSTGGNGGSTVAGGSGGSTATGGSGSTAGSGGSTIGSGGSTATGGSGGLTAAGGSGGSPVGSGGSTAAGGSGGSTDAGGGTGGNGGSGGSTAGDSGAGSAALVPAQGALLGVFYSAQSVSATDTMIGRKPNIRLVYYAWNDDWTRGASSDLSDGRIPLVNWEPFTPKLDDIIGGTYDTMIHQRAAAAKALAKPFFLDWGAEMNGDWSPWGGAQNGQSPDKYVAAYKHIHDIFVADGATNVVWAWCPNVTDEPRETWNDTMGYYPGDTYVDWVCVDGYNWGSTNGGRWQSFQQVFASVYPKLAAKGKPILIGEMASAEAGGDKAAWIDAIIPTLKSSFPMFKGLVWFDINKETDWRIASTTASRDAFIRMANDPYMNP